MTDFADAPVIRLAGRDWKVPVLSIKQNRTVLPAFLKFMPTFARIQIAVARKDEDPMWWTHLDITTDDMDRMCDATYGALLKAYPGMARNEFDNLEISLAELFAALPVIAQQTGILQSKSVAETESASGEAPATRESTSTSSSPTTAPAPENIGPTN